MGLKKKAVIKYVKVGVKVGRKVGRVVGPVIEGAFFVYKLVKNFYKWAKGDINRKEFFNALVILNCKTAGSIVGGFIGTAIGAAIGSIIPGPGTTVGGVIGATVGGFIGSKGAKHIGKELTAAIQ